MGNLGLRRGVGLAALLHAKSSFTGQIRQYRSTWTCTSYLASTDLSRSIAVAAVFPRARKQMGSFDCKIVLQWQPSAVEGAKD